MTSTASVRRTKNDLHRGILKLDTREPRKSKPQNKSGLQKAGGGLAPGEKSFIR